MLSSIVCGSAEVTPEMAVRFGDEAAHATYERCGQAASEAFHHNWDAATKEFWQFIPIVIVVPALIVWGLVSLVIVTVRWIREGFA
jgi:hypothetical protein